MSGCSRLRSIASVEVTEQAQEAYAERVNAMLRDTVWVAGGCQSWYLDANGDASVNWPGSAWRYRRWTRRVDLESYHVVRRPLRVVVDAPAPVEAVGA